MGKMNENMDIRLNKYLSDSGVCSRREADMLIERGRVTVDGSIASKGMRVKQGSRVYVDGRPIKPENELIVLAYNKPRGVVCTSSSKEPENIYRYLNYPGKLKYIGRLDKMSEGLILFTNRGSFADAVSRAGNYHEKEYIVTVNQPVTPEFLKAMSSGVTIEIEGRKFQTRPCKVMKLGACRFSIVLTQGFNRQIRRMCLVKGYRVTSLIRVRIMSVELGELKTGQYRLLDKDEIQRLLDGLSGESGRSVQKNSRSTSMRK